AARMIDDLDLARLDDEELEVAVADGEQRLPVRVRPGHGGRAAAQPGDLGLVEGREGDGLEVVFGHALVPLVGRGPPAAGFAAGPPEVYAATPYRDREVRCVAGLEVEVTLTRGFWMGKYEVTQGQWKRVPGKLPGGLTAAGGAGDDFPVYNVNYAVHVVARLLGVAAEPGPGAVAVPQAPRRRRIILTG